MLVWTWGTWPQLLVDFGRELYVAWRLAEGDVLYRDIAYFNGPLSPHLNALWFRVAGPSLRNLVILNLVITASITVVLYGLLLRVASTSAAIAGALTFVFAFAFNHVEALGNDTYVAPYSHEATHGMLLSLAALLLFARGTRGSTIALAGSGFAIGLVFLTKAEIFLAIVLALAAGVFLDTGNAHGSRSRVRSAGVLVGAALTPILASVALLAIALPPTDAVHGTLGSWTSVFNGKLSALHYYRDALGLVNLDDNLLTILRWTAGYLGYVALVTGVALAVARTVAVSMALAAGVTLLTYLGLAGLSIDWFGLARPLVVILPALLTVVLRRAFAGRAAAADRATLRLQIACLVFASALLAKILFRVRLDEYGFVLAMPGCLVLVVVLVDWWPKAMPTAGSKRIVCAANLGALLLVATAVAGIAKQRIDQHSTPVGSDGDRFLATGAAGVVNALLEDIRIRTRADETLAVLPEGVMINYLARRVNPTGHVNFMPPEFAIFGEAPILQAFQANPPDWIVLVSRPVDEYGMRGFGLDFGVGLSEWVEQNYALDHAYGAPIERWNEQFGVELRRALRIDARSTDRDRFKAISRSPRAR